MQQLREFGVTSGTELGPLDIGAFARAIGAGYQYAGTPEALELRPAIADGGVTLIEVPAGDTAAVRTVALKARAKGTIRAALGEGIGARVKALISGRR
jgi:thiamine pyrophosphate-dependent acetolactate synthase large subunit-like protein